jgi:hypothetical protein
LHRRGHPEETGWNFDIGKHINSTTDIIFYLILAFAEGNISTSGCAAPGCPGTFRRAGGTLRKGKAAEGGEDDPQPDAKLGSL